MSTNFNEPENWISQAEAARIRGVTRQAMSRLIRNKKLQTLNIAGKVLLNRSEVTSFTPKRAGRPRNVPSK